MANEKNPPALDSSPPSEKSPAPDKSKSGLAFYYLFCGYCLGETIIALVKLTDWGARLDLHVFNPTRYFADAAAAVLFCVAMRFCGSNARTIATLCVLAMLIVQFVIAK